MTSIARPVDVRLGRGETGADRRRRRSHSTTRRCATGSRARRRAHPRLDERIRFLELAAPLGIASADVGMPGAGLRARRRTPEALCRAILDRRLPIVPELRGAGHRGGHPAGSRDRPEARRPGRDRALPGVVAGPRAWSRDGRWPRSSPGGPWVGFAVRRGAPVTFVAEDATRTGPDALRAILGAAVAAGASRICIADTVGQATPLGRVPAGRVRKAGRWMRSARAASGLDWHGHDDRGLAVASALAAACGGRGPPARAPRSASASGPATHRWSSSW